jgi:hypothetical protein
MSEYVSINMSMIMYTCIWANQLLANQLRSCGQKALGTGRRLATNAQSPFGVIRSGFCVLKDRT